MDNNQAESGGSLKSLEAKIDTLAIGVGDMNKRLSGVETHLSGVKTDLAGVKTDLAGVKTDLADVKTDVADVKTHLADVGKQLANVQITADETKRFGRDSWDSLKSLTRSMEEGFKAAKKDRDEQSQLIHAAIRHWGERVERIEQRPAQTRKRRS